MLARQRPSSECGNTTECTCVLADGAVDINNVCWDEEAEMRLCSQARPTQATVLSNLDCVMPYFVPRRCLMWPMQMLELATTKLH